MRTQCKTYLNAIKGLGAYSFVIGYSYHTVMYTYISKYLAVIVVWLKQIHIIAT